MIKSTKTGQKPPKNRFSHSFSSPNSGNTKKVKKTALKSVLDIINQIDHKSPKMADQIDKMIKKSSGIKIDHLGTTVQKIDEALSATGLPHDLQYQLGLGPKTEKIQRPNVPVYTVRPKAYEENIGGNQGGQFVFTGDDPKLVRKKDLGSFLTPAIFLRGSHSPSLIHESTHLYDPDITLLRSLNINQLEYQLNKHELLANFNTITSAIYFNNNLTYPVFMSQYIRKVPDMKTLKSANNSTIILWSLIKDSIEKNGLHKTIDMKNEIIEETQKYVCDNIANLFADVYFKNAKSFKFKDKIKSLKFIIKNVIISMKISPENKKRIINSFFKLSKEPSREWMPEKVKDEIYNFYGERYLRDQEEK